MIVNHSQVNIYIINIATVSTPTFSKLNYFQKKYRFREKSL